jgi:hypothetical protein
MVKLNNFAEQQTQQQKTFNSQQNQTDFNQQSVQNQQFNQQSAQTQPQLI